MKLLKSSLAFTTNTSRNYLAALFLFAAFVVLIILPLFQKGTFIDGQLYKTVAFNEGISSASFWNMKYTNTCMAFFCEQPPLYPFLLGRFYACFGTHYLVDRVFTLLLLMLFVVLIRAITRQLFTNAKGYNLLFLFLMVSVPIWCWSYANQVIEPLVCVFTAAGIFCFVAFLQSHKLIYGLAFAALLYASFLAKGFQSCFLITLPLAYFFMDKLSKRMAYLAVGTGLLLAMALVFTLKFYQPALPWFQCYYNARLVLTMQNVGNTTNNHGEIIIRFFTELIIPIAIVVALFIYLKRKKKYRLKTVLENFVADKLAMSLLITAIAGSFPYAISLVQRGFYLVPSFVCFLLALVYGFKRYWLFFFAFVYNLGKYKATRISVMLLFAGSLLYACLAFNSYKRDENLLTDLEKMETYLHEKDTVLIESDLWNYFSLHSYLYMQKQVSLSTDRVNSRFFICNRRSSFNVDSSYRLLNLHTQQLDLFVRATQNLNTK